LLFYVITFPNISNCIDGKIETTEITISTQQKTFKFLKIETLNISQRPDGFFSFFSLLKEIADS